MQNFNTNNLLWKVSWGFSCWRTRKPQRKIHSNVNVTPVFETSICFLFSWFTRLPTILFYSSRRIMKYNPHWSLKRRIVHPRKRLFQTKWAASIKTQLSILQLSSMSSTILILWIPTQNRTTSLVRPSWTISNSCTPPSPTLNVQYSIHPMVED